jgi:uncharacterized protein
MYHLVYLHGFLSSPLSHKARITADYVQQACSDWQYHCPALCAYPDEAYASIRQLFASLPEGRTAVIGSSLGGFWASLMAQHQIDLPVVLVNPAVNPQERIKEFVGRPLKNYYSDDYYTLEARHIALLQALAPQQPLQNPKRCWVLLQTGDETLDYRLAEKAYGHCTLSIEEGGNHSFEGYENYLPKIVQFFREHWV